MKRLESLSIAHRMENRNIELYQGDLTDMSQTEGVDILVISAYPGDYCPTLGSVIGALNEKGISVARLAEDKMVDLRNISSCWLSKEIVSEDPGIRFKHLLCFEPGERGKSPEIVGDIFRSLAPVLGDELSLHTVAIPLVACGDQRTPIDQMLPPLLEAAARWMSLGLNLTELKIV
ncbi:MAG: hypothetical protein MUP70_16640, partial [Candidatus Aminicenantes bacterium]|nr:hypothetical protein [Candidatus Aminicenantes bacterium]